MAGYRIIWAKCSLACKYDGSFTLYQRTLRCDLVCLIVEDPVSEGGDEAVQRVSDNDKGCIIWVHYTEIICPENIFHLLQKKYYQDFIAEHYTFTL